MHINKSLIALILVLSFLAGYVLAKSNLDSVTNVLPQSCEYKGIMYKDGEGFADDCNSCSCQDGGVQCTLIACDADLPELGYEEPVVY